MTTSPRTMTAAVVGSAEASPAELAAAEQVGRALVDEGFRVLTGGRGGVMEAACRGARSSSQYQPGATIGVLPGYDKGDANPHCDIVIATGMQHARNVIVVASADVVVAVGGRAGTLSELALAWTIERPIVAVAVTAEGPRAGWATRLAGQAVDDRRQDIVHGPYAPRDAALACRALLERDPPPA